MDSTTMWIIIGVVALLALFFYNRNRPAPRGTYDDKNVRSSGSIGGGTRAYDDPAHRSSGSIGGAQSGYDSPEHQSSGSIGGAPNRVEQGNRVEQERRNERDVTPDRPLKRLDLNNDLDDDDNNNRSARDTDSVRERRDNTRTIDDERFKSKGSIGG
jgi:hypothetical protein